MFPGVLVPATLNSIALSTSPHTTKASIHHSNTRPVFLHQYQSGLKLLTNIIIALARSSMNSVNSSAQPSGDGPTVLSNIPDKVSSLEKINNFRDLAEAVKAIKPGRVLRCAKPSEASPGDADALLKAAGICDLIDLRSNEELAEDPNPSHLFSQANLRKYTRGWFSSQVRPVPGTNSTAPVVHHQVSLLERYRFYFSLLNHIPRTSTLLSLAWRLISREWSRQVILRHVNEGGLGLLYRIIVDSAAPEIGCVLRLVLEGLEAQRPVLVFCKAGKDRTGVICTLLAVCAGASEDEIMDDYTKSDAFHQVALAGIEKKAELQGLDRSVFERAPAPAMHALLQHWEQVYGGPEAYMEKACGFGKEQQARMRELLTGDAALQAA